MVLLASGTAGVPVTASLYFWFFLDSVGGGVWVRSSVKWLVLVRALSLGGDNVRSS